MTALLESPVVTPYTFQGQQGMGRDGEEAVWALLRRMGHMPCPYDRPEELEVDLDHQQRGIDAVVYLYPDSPDPHDWGEAHVEVKTDAYPTGNVAVELEQVRADGSTRPGCALSSEADYWLYVRVPYGEVLVLPGQPFRSWASTLTPTCDVLNVDLRTGRRYSARVALVPTPALHAAGVVSRTLILPPDLSEPLSKYIRR